MPRQKQIIPREKSIAEQQRDILIRAINDYLAWRNNKNEPDDRGYPVTFFTRLRHYTAFGENRANNLKQALSLHPISNTISVLQDHFQKDSKIENHSLDTYLLESILENKYLFLISRDFNKLDTKILRAQLRDLILEQRNYTQVEYAFKIGKLYQEDNTVHAHLEKALKYYLVAIRQDYRAAHDALLNLARKGNNEAQYIIGFEYYHRKNNFRKAIKWCLQAAEQQHPKAIAYLRNTKFDVKYYLMLAKKYGQGDGIEVKITSSIFFYKKAYALKNIEAARRLGQLYQPFPVSKVSFDSESIAQFPEKDAYKAFSYYLVAAEQADEKALEGMADIVKQIDDDNLRFKLGEIYLEIFGNPVQAFSCFKNLLEKDNVQTKEKLDKLVTQKPEYAYMLGKLYEEDATCQDYLVKACWCYDFALEKGHKPAYKALYKLAELGNSEAQYRIGFNYYHEKGKEAEAISWCLQAAEQGHVQALAYLKSTNFTPENYVSLAKKYEEGNEVAANITSAILFYKKACALRNIEAARWLGQLYQPTTDREINILSVNCSVAQLPEKDAYKSFNYYLVAAEQQDEASLTAMTEIAEQLNDDKLKYKIGKIYLNIFAKPLLALNYFKDLADKDNRRAIKKVRTLAKTDPEYAYILGQLYEEDNNHKDNRKKACYYYSFAIQHDHPATYEALIKLAKDEYSEAQFILGYKYYHSQAKFDKAIYWCLLASDQHHLKAKAYLRNTKFDVKYYVMLARKYEKGEGVIANIDSSIFFYKKAYVLKSKEAALWLGQFYWANSSPTTYSNPSTQDKIQTSARAAFNYYLMAAEQHEITALEVMREIVEHLDDNTLRFILAETYLKVFGNIKLAFYYFKFLMDKGIEEAIKKVDTLTSTTAEYAWTMGSLYQDDMSNEDNIVKACSYYVLAIRDNHEVAYSALKALASAGCSEAQYSVGAFYYHPRGEINRAIYFCLQAAEQNHKKAIAYLNETEFTGPQYLMIAKRYEQGDEVKKDFVTAIKFYEKACDLNNAEAALHLGQLYNPSLGHNVSLSGDNNIIFAKCYEKAFNYYDIAARQKNKFALNAMQAIASRNQEDKLHFRLAELYLDVFEDIEAGLRCLKSLADKNFIKALQRLKTLTQANSDYAYFLGKLYQEDAEEISLQKSCYYYAVAEQQQYQLADAELNKIIEDDNTSTTLLNAMALTYFEGDQEIKQNLVKAKRIFENASKKGSEIAHYYLGLMYHERKGCRKDLVMAAKHYLLAESKGYSLAEEKLNELINSSTIKANQLVAIASFYQEEAMVLVQNWPRVVMCYQRASQLGDISATLYLAQFYELSHAGVPKDNLQSFNFYLQVAQVGNSEALIPLERLANKLDAKEQRRLSQTYLRFFSNHEKSHYWKEKADETIKLRIKL